MRAALVLNGEPPAPGWLRSVGEDFPVYAADGGAKGCLDAGVTPVKVVGDFDSVEPGTLPADWAVERRADQNSTDFEKVLHALPPEVDEVLVAGGFGRRLDHLLTNLLIAAALPARMGVRFEDGRQCLWRVTPERPWEGGELRVGSTLSILPLSGARGVCTEGLCWNLHEAEMGIGRQLGQSNRVEGPVSVRVEEGNLFLWAEMSMRR